jgi:hypothetical protein
MRAPSLCKRQKASRIAGAGRLGEVVARKALKGGGDSAKREAERNQISADRCSKVMFLRLIPYLGFTPPLFAYPGGIERSRGKCGKHLT